MRNISLALAIATTTLVTGCADSETGDPSATGEATLNFGVLNYEQIDIDALSTRASSGVSSLSYLVLGVYDAESLEPTIDEIRQTAGDEDYGSFSVTLPYGNYKLVFLGWYAEEEGFPSMKNPLNISFAGDRVPHLFCKTLDLAVGMDTETNQTVELSRVVACFSVCMSDAIPEGTDYIEVIAEGGGRVLNALTGYAYEACERTSEIDISGAGGKTDQSFCVYTFLTESEDTMTFTCTAYGTDGNEVAKRNFTDVPMKINRLTYYTGNFFTESPVGNGFSISLADSIEWTDTYEYTPK